MLNHEILNILQVLNEKHVSVFDDSRQFTAMMKDLTKNDREHSAIIRWLGIALSELDAFSKLKNDFNNNHDFARYSIASGLIAEGASEETAKSVVGYLAVLAGFELDVVFPKDENINTEPLESNAPNYDYLNDEELRHAESLFIKSKFDEARILFSELAKRGNVRAMFYLGEYGRTDAITGRTRKRSESYHKKGHKLGDILCTYGLARTLLSKGNESAEKMLSDVFDQLLAIANEGNPVVQNIVGACYESGYGTAVNTQLAFHYYNLSAEHGFSWAQNNVANCYLHGTGVTPDTSQAQKYTKLSASQGFIPAFFNMGLFSLHEDKYHAAVYWYKRAAENGYASAIQQLESLGEDVPLQPNAVTHTSDYNGDDGYNAEDTEPSNSSGFFGVLKSLGKEFLDHAQKNADRVKRDVEYKQRKK